MLLCNISGLLYHHCFFFLYMIEYYIVIYDHCCFSYFQVQRLSLIAEIFTSVIILKVFMIVSFCFYYCNPHCFLVVPDRHSDPLLLAVPLSSAPWTTVINFVQKLLSNITPHGDLSEILPVTLQQVFNLLIKTSCCHLIFSPSYNQPHCVGHYVNLYLNWWFSVLDDIRCFPEVHVALFHLPHKINYWRMVSNFGRVSCLDHLFSPSYKLLFMNL